MGFTPEGRRILVYSSKPVDLRKSIDELAGLEKSVIGGRPLIGEFIRVCKFVNRGGGSHVGATLCPLQAQRA